MDIGGLIGVIPAASKNTSYVQSYCSNVDMDIKCKGINLTVGGLIGRGNINTMNCYAIGNIILQNSIGGKNYIGGITGYNSTNVDFCYSNVDIVVKSFGSGSETYAGGIVGYNYSGGSNANYWLESCYSVGSINAYSDSEGTILVIGSIYAYSNTPERIQNNLELNNQELIANKGQTLGNVIESETKYSFEEILTAIHTALKCSWRDSYWDFYNDKNPTLKFENF